MRTVYARAEDALTLATFERIVGTVERPGTLTEYCIGEIPPACTIAAIRRALPTSLLTALAIPAYHRKSDHDAWQWAPPEERRTRRKSRLTHAGRLRKRRQ